MHRYEDAFEPNLEEEVRDRANAWVARFAPLVMRDDPAMDVSEVRSRLALIESLHHDGPELAREVDALGPGDHELAETLRHAVAQLDSIESDLRRRMARLEPGDPAGLVDYDALQDRLAERRARQEVGVETEAIVPKVLEMQINPGNMAAATGMGVFGLGWTGFTLVHCILMIGGMSKAFGWLALGLLAFYAIFFMVGFGMLYGAYLAAADESIQLHGRKLTIIRTFAGIRRTKSVELDADAGASIGRSTAASNNNARSPSGRAILLHDSRGRTIQLGSHASDHQRETALKRINAYLKVHG